MLLDSLNYLAILAAAAAATAIGALWYAPFAFGPAWLASLGQPAQALTAPDRITLVRSGLNALMSAFVLAIVLYWGEIDGYGRGMIAGVIVCAGFVLTATYLRVVYEDASARFFTLTAGHQLLSYAAMGAILGAWQ